MDSRKIICFLAFFVLAVSTVTALKCIQCSIYLNSTAPSAEEPCDTRKKGPGVPCEDDKVCSRTYDMKTNLLTRGCDHKKVCDNLPNSTKCSTCSTDLCGSSGYHINPLYAPVLAGLLFATLST